VKTYTPKKLETNLIGKPRIVNGVFIKRVTSEIMTSMDIVPKKIDRIILY
jgi:hypothetical protein